MFSKDGLKRLYGILASKELTLILFGVICAASLPGAFSERRGYYASPFFMGPLWLLGLHLLLCTVQRLKTIPLPVLIIHTGVLATLAGAAVTATGFVATANIYEGGTIDRVYRWDRDENFFLGFTVTVKKIGMEYYPVPVRVGVLRGNEKAGLFTLKTGESFNLGEYAVRIDALDDGSESLELSVFHQGQFIGRTATSGMSELPPGFPYSFVLVAYKNPAPRQVRVDLSLARGPELTAEGTLAANEPFDWQGFRFSNTQIERDPYGNPYAGIQITRDPGRPLVYAGFVMLLAGLLFWTYRRLRA